MHCFFSVNSDNWFTTDSLPCVSKALMLKGIMLVSVEFEIEINFFNNFFSTTMVSRYNTAIFIPYCDNFSIAASPKPLDPPSITAHNPWNCFLFVFTSLNLISFTQTSTMIVVLIEGVAKTFCYYANRQILEVSEGSKF